MEKLIEGMRHFREHLFWERQEVFERSAQGQRPLALLITCSDSRVLPDSLTQADPGDLFVHRNAGNLVPAHGAPTGESATVEYAVTALKVTDLIVCGHYRCGAVQALLNPEAAAGMPQVSGWLAHAADAKAVMDREHADLRGAEQWDRAVEVNVLVQLDSLSKHPVVAAGLAAGRLRLHAWVLRFESGEVLAFDPHAGAFKPLLEMPAVHPALPASDDCCAGPAAPPAPEPKAPEPARFWEALRHDLAASLVVFLVALPLCLAIAKACGAPPEAGLITGLIGGTLVGLLSGSPLQVSGPSVGLVVILIDVIQRYGLERFGAVIVLAGLLQLLAAALGLGRWFRAVSPAVVLGMLAGIGVVLFAQQFHVMVDDPPTRDALSNLATIPRAVWWGLTDTHPEHPEHREAAVIGLTALVVLLGWPLVTRRSLRTVPAALVAVVSTAALTAALGLPVQRITFEGLGTAVRFLDPGAVLPLLADRATWVAALTVALVASAETLLCAAAVDGMHSGARSRYDRELGAQGVGNAVCGAIGVLPVTGAVVRSAANIRAGGRTRWATVLHGVWLLLLALLAPGLLRLIPTAALAGVLVLNGVRLVNARAVRALWAESRGEAVICVLTAVAVAAVDLLSGVLVGVALSTVKLVHTFSRLRIRRRGDPAAGRLTLVLEGAATFLRLPKLAAALDAVPPGATVHIDTKGLSYIDHACLSLLAGWEKQYGAGGGRLVIDWETLRARFHTARPRPRASS